MIDARTFARRTEALQQMFQRKLGVKSRDLAQALRRTGRRLPRHLRKQGAFLVKAEQLVGNPKLARQVRPLEIEQALDALSAHLEAIDAADARLGKWLNIAGTLAFNVLIVLAGFILWLWWRGYV